MEEDYIWTVQSIDRILEINQFLPEDEKIRVISISKGIDKTIKSHEKLRASIRRAEAAGIFVIYSGRIPLLGLGRDLMADPEELVSYTKGIFLQKGKQSFKQVSP